LKALHPSDPITEVRGIPDRSAVPSVALNYQSTFTLTPEAAATGTWSCDLALLPHPVNFMYWNKTDSVGTNFGNFMNTQLDGAAHSDKFASFRAMAQRWRMTYMSVTLYQDGPDLANQGTIVACQTPVKPTRANSARSFGTYAGANGFAFVPIEAYSVADKPEYTTSQSMPNAYFSRSKEGAYLPLKLTKTCQQWAGADSLVMCNDTLQTPAYDLAGIIPVGTTATNGLYPHTNLVQCWVLPATGAGGGQATSPMLNDTWGMLSLRNLAVTTSLSLFVRAGFEIQCQPGTPFSSHLKLSPQHDSQALDTYFRISRELKDAYPADYNDLGKIWDVISSVAKTVAPGLGFIPGVGPLLSTAVTGVASAGDAIRAAVSRTQAPGEGGRVNTAASQGDLERIRGVLAAGRENAAAAFVPRLLKAKKKIAASVKRRPGMKRRL